VGVLDVNGVLLDCNEAPLQAAGITMDDVRGRRFEDCYWWDYSPQVQQRVREAIDRAAAGETSRFDINARMAGGRMMTLDFNISPMFDEHGRITHLIPSAVDISDRKRAEDALRQSEERFRTLAGATFEGVCLSEDGIIRECNDQLCRMLGYTSRDELIGKEKVQLFTPESREVIAGYIRSGQDSVTEHEMLCRDGSRRTVEVHGRTVEHLGRRIRITALRDITERKRDEELLRRSEAAYREQLAELQAIYDSVPIGLCMLDKDLRYVKVNRVLAAINNRPMEEHIGRTIFEVVPEMAARLHETLQTAIETRTPVLDLEICECAPDQPGVPRYWTGNFLPLLDENLNLRGVNMTVQETTERHMAEQQRAQLLEAERAARTEAERHVRLKDEFLATVSHELRSPLNAIVGWTRLLAKGSVETSKAVDIISRSAATLTQIVEDLLDMSRIISGKIRLKREPVDLATLIHNTVEGVQMAAEAKSIHVEVSVDPSLRPLECDPNRLQQIVWNLLTNAIKFTPEQGQVYVAVHQGYREVHISVRDTGQGIAPEFLPHLFERFSQQDGSIARRHGGLGLGLAIVKSLVELHGGRVHVESEGEGKGALFTVSLPGVRRDPVAESASSLARTRTPADLDLDEHTLRGVKVLCVDDDAYSRELLERVLSDAGASVRTADCCEAALAAMDEFRPDLLISDIGMPGEDGYSFIARIRSLGDWRSELPCIAVTALSRREDHVRALQVGYDEHVGKPFDPSTLCLVAGRLLRGRSKSAGAVAPVSVMDSNSSSGRADRRHVLVVEDSENIGQLLKTCLEEQGYRVTIATSLAEALEAANADPVHLLLSDLRLNDGMSWDLLARLRPRVPGIVISGYVDEEHVARSKAAGFAQYLVKPVEPERVVAVVRELLNEPADSGGAADQRV